MQASLKTIPQGAATTVWCATSPLLNDLGGVYCENVDVALLSLDNELIDDIKPYSLDEYNAQRLWNLSEEMTGITFELS